MKSYIFLCLFVLPIIIHAEDCPSIINRLSNNNFGSFGGDVAHAIHSITVDQLRLLEDNITVDNNNIPTVNLDLRAPDAILPYAPEAEASPFMTDAMRAIDAVLSHWDNPNYDIRGFSIVERLVHVFHMRESWAMIARMYNEIKSSKRPSESECACVRDIDSNGVLKSLRYIALAVREPALVYGSQKKAPYYVPYSYTYRPLVNKQDQPSISVLSESDVLKKESDAMIELKDEASWTVWKNLMETMDPVSHYNTALFLYCALNIN